MGFIVAVYGVFREMSLKMDVFGTRTFGRRAAVAAVLLED